MLREGAATQPWADTPAPKGGSCLSPWAALTEILQTNPVPHKRWKLSSQPSGGWGVEIMALAAPCLVGTHVLTEGHLLTIPSQPPSLKGGAGSL